MMSRKKYSLLFLTVIVLMILINSAAAYFSFGSRKYFESFGKVCSRDIIIRSYDYLSSADKKDYVSEFRSLVREKEELQKYIYAVGRLGGGRKSNIYRGMITEKEAAETVSKYSLTESQAQERMEQIRYCQKRLEYAAGYQKYVDGILENSEDLSAVGLFNDSVCRNSAKTASDYFGLSGIRISAEPDEGIVLLFSDIFSDIIVCISAVLCAFVYVLRCRACVSEDISARSRMIVFAVLFAVSAAAVYSSNILISASTVPFGSFQRPVQSAEMFRSCTLIISAGAFTAVRILFKTAACLTIYFIFTAIISSCKKIPIASAVVAFSAFSVFCLLNNRFYGFFSLFRPEKIFGNYENIMILGQPVGKSALFTVLSVLILSVWAAAAFRSIRTFMLSASEKAENEYFDEINRRYSELRMIRHDMKNHLSVVSVLLEKGQTQEAVKYIGEINDELETVKPPAKTGSGVLDALLFRKTTDAVHKNISIVISFFSDFSDSGFSDYDLCGIFSNIIDNACEACEKLPEDQRTVTLSVREQMDMVCIFCENRYSEINMSAGSPVTLKSDRSSHGLGIGRIQRTAERYGGTVEINTDDGVFSISVLLMKKK